MHEFGIGGGAAPAVVDENRIGIEADDAAARTDPRAEQDCDAARAAAEIEAAPALGDADLLQHDRAIRRHRRTLAMEPLDLALAPLDRVMAAVFVHRCM